MTQKNGEGEVLHAIPVVAFAVYGEEEMDESVLLEKEDQIIKEYGYWHFYWALLFFSGTYGTH